MPGHPNRIDYVIEGILRRRLLDLPERRHRPVGRPHAVSGSPLPRSTGAKSPALPVGGLSPAVKIGTGTGTGQPH